MADIPEELVEKAAQAIANSRSIRDGNRGMAWNYFEDSREDANAALATVLPHVVDRDALARELWQHVEWDTLVDDAGTWKYDPLEMCYSQVASLIAHGLLQDVTDVRRQITEEIANALATDELLTGELSANYAARLARKVGEATA